MSPLGQHLDRHPAMVRHAWTWRGYVSLGIAELDAWRRHPASRRLAADCRQVVIHHTRKGIR